MGEYAQTMRRQLIGRAMITTSVGADIPQSRELPALRKM
jgi:hypothetical protein